VAGTQVTITGKNFRPGIECRIQLGQLSFPVNDVTENRIRFTIPFPPGPSDFPIKVEIGGQLGVSEEIFNVPY
jgi:hypothetical protein